MSQFVSIVFISVTYCPRIMMSLISLGDDSNNVLEGSKLFVIVCCSV